MTPLDRFASATQQLWNQRKAWGSELTDLDVAKRTGRLIAGLPKEDQPAALRVAESWGIELPPLYAAYAAAIERVAGLSERSSATYPIT